MFKKKTFGGTKEIILLLKSHKLRILCSIWKQILMLNVIKNIKI